MESCSAFAPANISLIFETYDASPPRGRGSLGVGITLTEGVTVRAQKGKEARHEILVGGEEWEFGTVRSVLEVLSPNLALRLEVAAAFPFGCGFGMSGASALAAAFAVDRLLRLDRAREELGMIAHHAEVQNATGLGDVGGQFNGGIMIKRSKYDYLKVEQLPVKAATLHVRIFGPILTSEVINSREKLLHINEAGRSAIKEITEVGEHLTLNRLLNISKDFALHSWLPLSKRLCESIAAAEAAGHAATMIMLGEAAVSSGPFPGSRPVKVHHDGVRLLA